MEAHTRGTRDLLKFSVHFSLAPSRINFPGRKSGKWVDRWSAIIQPVQLVTAEIPHGLFAKSFVCDGFVLAPVDGGFQKYHDRDNKSYIPS